MLSKESVCGDFSYRSSLAYSRHSILIFRIVKTILKALRPILLGIMSVPALLSPIADILSLLGFGLTVWVLIVTRSLKRTFALRARTPELRKSLEASAKKLSALLGRWPESKNETFALIANARAVLENLSAKLPRSEKSAVACLVKEMRGRREGWLTYTPIARYTEDDLWKIFADLQGVIASLEQRERDASWE